MKTRACLKEVVNDCNPKSFINLRNQQNEKGSSNFGGTNSLKLIMHFPEGQYGHPFRVAK